jgi:DNA-binding XRE family transcriptional regulator
MAQNTRRYTDFGITLKLLRIKHRQTTNQLASALAVDRTFISKLENGHDKPSRELIGKIISHFSLSPNEAMTLWNQASGLTVTGEQGKEESYMSQAKQPMFIQQPAPNQPTNVNINIDAARTPTLYTDNVFVGKSDVGVTLDFAQSVGPTGQVVVQSRIGMSQEQAKRLIEILKNSLGIE